MQNTTNTQPRESGREEGQMAFTEIVARPASEKGALAHFATTCTECGMVLASTMQSEIPFDMQRHADYHAVKAAKVAAPKWTVYK